jgi:hypothetical protein
MVAIQGIFLLNDFMTSTYCVPLSISVLCVFDEEKTLDNPRSAIFGVMVLSSKILAGFKSK